MESLETAGFSIPPRQLDSWVEKTKNTGSAIKESKETGASARLTREKRDVTSGWALHEYETGSLVSIASYYDFALEKFGVELSTGTIRNYLDDDGF